MKKLNCSTTNPDDRLEHRSKKNKKCCNEGKTEVKCLAFMPFRIFLTSFMLLYRLSMGLLDYIVYASTRSL